MKTYLNPEFALEAQKDHLNCLSAGLSAGTIPYCSKELREIGMDCAKKAMEQAERFYPNHPTTLKMRAEFDELKKD